MIRFCVAAGFSGYQEFKLRLAQSLALGRTATHSVISQRGHASAVAEKIFEYTITSLDWARGALDSAALEEAVERRRVRPRSNSSASARRRMVAEDAQQKFPLFGVPCRAQADFHQQIMTASMMRPTDVAVVISNTGRTRQIAQAAETARNSGAKVIGIVGAADRSATRATSRLVVETLDNTNIYTPTTSRIAALVVIDILSTAVALRRDPADIERLKAMKQRLNLARADEP